MKLKKKSGLMGAVIALSAASLISVGFASWVISQGETESFAGTITVDDVQNEIHTFSAKWYEDEACTLGETTSAEVIFGYDADYNDKWLHNDDPDMEAKLDYYLKISVDNTTTDDNIADIIKLGQKSGDPASWDGAVTIDESAASAIYSQDGFYYTANADGRTAEETKGWTLALAQQYVVAPTITKITSGDKMPSDGVVICKVHFGWGDKFGGVNPSEHYYNQTADAKAAEAVKYLSNLEVLLTNVSFSLRVETL